MKKFDFVVVGNNIGALVSAIELAKKHKIALINPSKNWGAHFGGINIDNENYDIGMKFFEFTTFHNSNNDLLSYNPSIRNDSARFFGLVESYIKERIDYVEVDKIEVLAEKTYASDIIMANSLEILKSLPVDTINKIQREIRTILKIKNNQLHASHKKNNEALFLNANYFDVSLANHGRTFHELFIEPYCKKIFNLSSRNIPALFHRIVWTPLFYPETLLQGIEGKDEMIKTKFHYPKEGNFSKIINSFFNEIKTNQNTSIIYDKIDSFKKEEQYSLKINNQKLLAKKLIWCSDLKNLLNTAKIPFVDFKYQKASVCIAFCIAERQNIKREFATLYVSENRTPIYRITNQNFSSQKSNRVKLIIEMNHDVCNEFQLDNKEKVTSHINTFLIDNNILYNKLGENSVNIKIIMNAVNHPSIFNFNNFLELQKLTTELLSDVELIGPSSGFVSTSFNDQVVQGLKLGIKY